MGRQAVDLTRSTDEPDSKGLALIDLAEVLAAAGKEVEAAQAAGQAAALFEAKGNLVSAARAALLVERLRAGVLA